VSLAIGALVVTAPAASAEAPDQSGWWTSAPVAVAPDAPSDGLVVQGGQDTNQPTSFAAVSYALSGATAEKLKLTVASGSASTPSATLALCPLSTSGFSPAQGGSSSDAPKFDCTNKVTAAPSSDGTTYTFDVASLVRSEALAVAIVPTTSTDRVVFQKPDDSSLQTSAAASSDFTSSDSSSFTTPDASSPPSETSLDLSTAPVPSASSPPNRA